MNDQKTVVDYTYWLKMDLWTIKEAASLLSSVEPSSDSSSLAIPSKVEKMGSVALLLKKYSSSKILSFFLGEIILWRQ